VGAKRLGKLHDIDWSQGYAGEPPVFCLFLNAHHVVEAVNPNQVDEIDFKRTAVSSSIAENRNPPSPEITFSLGRTRLAAIAQWQADTKRLWLSLYSKFWSFRIARVTTCWRDAMKRCSPGAVVSG